MISLFVSGRDIRWWTLFWYFLLLHATWREKRKENKVRPRHWDLILWCFYFVDASLFSMDIWIQILEKQGIYYTDVLMAWGFLCLLILQNSCFLIFVYLRICLLVYFKNYFNHLFKRSHMNLNKGQVKTYTFIPHSRGCVEIYGLF